MKKRMIDRAGFIVVMIGFLMLGFVSVASAWNVKLSNDTGYTVRVRALCTTFPPDCIHREWQDIQSGSSYTWNTGGWCPSAFEGWIIVKPGDENSKKTLQPHNLLTDSDIGDSCRQGGPLCMDSSWKVCKKGSGTGAIQDRDYGFCR